VVNESVRMAKVVSVVPFTTLDDTRLVEDQTPLRAELYRDSGVSMVPWNLGDRNIHSRVTSIEEILQGASDAEAIEQPVVAVSSTFREGAGACTLGFRLPKRRRSLR